jgi:hypothetical protein
MRLTARAAWVVGASLIALGCAGSKEPGGPGEDCYRDEDCKSGLVCVANMSGVRVCSNDVTSLVSMRPGPPAPEDAGAPPEEIPPEEIPPEEMPADDAGAP